MHCNFFVCEQLNDGVCGHTGEACMGHECKGCFSNCIMCIKEDCAFKKLYDARYQEAVLINNEKIMEAIAARSIARRKAVAKANGTLKDVPAQKNSPTAAIIENPAKDVIPYAYVDGSYNNFTKTYGYGGIVNDGKIHTLQGRGNDVEMASMRNVAGEIAGAMAAIQYAIDHQFKEIKIYYDYTGIEAWATGEWQANKEGTIRYREFCQKCPVKLQFVKVKGHSGVEGNEIADKLAKQAVGIA